MFSALLRHAVFSIIRLPTPSAVTEVFRKVLADYFEILGLYTINLLRTRPATFNELLNSLSFMTRFYMVDIGYCCPSSSVFSLPNFQKSSRNPPTNLKKKEDNPQNVTLRACAVNGQSTKYVLGGVLYTSST
jgi:hypothetical protein